MHSVLRFLSVTTLFCALIAAQTTWHVLGNGTPAGMGTVASPFGSIQQAITAAQSGDRIEVHAGTYTESVDFQGKNVVVEAVDGPTQTVINGNGAERVVVFFTGENRNAILVGFQITGGRGGITCALGASPTIARCQIIGNATVAVGAGAEVLDNSQPLFVECVFANNTAGNPAASGGGEAGLGGGLALMNGAMAAVHGCRFDGNVAGGQPTLGSPKGGGIYVGSGCVLRMVNSVVANNVALGTAASESYGGGIIAENGAIDLVDCRIIGNTARNAGGIFAWSGSLKQCIVAGNTANVGSGMVAAVGPFSIHHCTVTANQGTAFVTQPNTTLDMRNSIVWGNSQPPFIGSATVVVTNTNIQGGYSGSGNFDLNPQFVNAATFDFRLSTTSPCRDTGHPLTMGAINADFEGEPRLMGSAPDLGVDEYVDPSVAHSVEVGTGCPIPGAGPLTLSTTTLPLIGSTNFAIQVSNAPANGAAWLFLSDKLAIVPEPLAGSCTLLIDLLNSGAYITVALSPIGPIAANAAGLAALPVLIPNDPGIIGADICLQAAATSTPLLPAFFTSNALYLRLH